jgi:hypothetical protein
MYHLAVQYRKSRFFKVADLVNLPRLQMRRLQPNLAYLNHVSAVPLAAVNSEGLEILLMCTETKYRYQL